MAKDLSNFTPEELLGILNSVAAGSSIDNAIAMVEARCIANMLHSLLCTKKHYSDGGCDYYENESGESRAKYITMATAVMTDIPLEDMQAVVRRLGTILGLREDTKRCIGERGLEALDKLIKISLNVI